MPLKDCTILQSLLINVIKIKKYIEILKKCEKKYKHQMVEMKKYGKLCDCLIICDDEALFTQ